MRIGCTPAAVLVAGLALAAAPGAGAEPTGGTAAGGSGGTTVGDLPLPAPVATMVGGVAKAPAGAPRAVRRAIRAGNRLQAFPYRYGGGHRAFKDTAYDCSGTVSFALHGGRLLKVPLDSTSLSRWGVAGEGRWITVYANRGHAYMVIAGLRLDTSGTGGRGPRWQTAARSSAGFVARHPAGL
jgi:hypothetical protein